MGGFDGWTVAVGLFGDAVGVELGVVGSRTFALGACVLELLRMGV